MYLNTLNPLNGWIVWYVNQISINLLMKKVIRIWKRLTLALRGREEDTNGVGCWVNDSWWRGFLVPEEREVGIKEKETIGAQHCDWYFMHIHFLGLNNPMRWALLSTVYEWGQRVSKRSSDSLWVTQPARKRTRIQDEPESTSVPEVPRSPIRTDSSGCYQTSSWLLFIKGQISWEREGAVRGLAFIR